MTRRTQECQGMPGSRKKPATVAVLVAQATPKTPQTFMKTFVEASHTVCKPPCC